VDSYWVTSLVQMKRVLLLSLVFTQVVFHMKNNHVGHSSPFLFPTFGLSNVKCDLKAIVIVTRLLNKHGPQPLRWAWLLSMQCANINTWVMLVSSFKWRIIFISSGVTRTFLIGEKLLGSTNSLLLRSQLQCP
jgi:carbon starvation protein CstA